MIELEVLNPGKSSQRYKFDKALVTIGSNADNDLVIDDPRVAPLQFRLSIQGEFMHAEDVPAKNGLWIDGRNTSQAFLAPGQEFGLYPFKTRLRIISWGQGMGGESTVEASREEIEQLLKNSEKSNPHPPKELIKAPTENKPREDSDLLQKVRALKDQIARLEVDIPQLETTQKALKKFVTLMGAGFLGLLLVVTVMLWQQLNQATEQMAKLNASVTELQGFAKNAKQQVRAQVEEEKQKALAEVQEKINLQQKKAYNDMEDRIADEKQKAYKQIELERGKMKVEREQIKTEALCSVDKMIFSRAKENGIQLKSKPRC